MAIDSAAPGDTGRGRAGGSGLAVTSGRRRWPAALVACTAILTGAAIEAGLCGVALVTPPDPVLRDAMRLVGGLIGLTAAASLMRSRIKPATRLNRAVMWLVLPLAGLTAGNAVSERWTGLWAFAGSAAPWEDATYPILALNHSAKGNHSQIVIDPLNLGNRTQIPIPDRQYRPLLQSGVTGLCVTVQQRRAPNGAVEVRTGKPYRLFPGEPAATEPCSGAPDPWR